jgi:hypothetical protein
MTTFAGIMAMLNLASKLTPVIVPELVAIAKSIEGFSDRQIMTIDEFDASIKETQARAKNRKWDDPI